MKNNWTDILRARSQIMKKDKDSFHEFIGKMDPYLYAFLILVLMFFVMSIFAIL